MTTTVVVVVRATLPRGHEQPLRSLLRDRLPLPLQNLEGLVDHKVAVGGSHWSPQHIPLTLYGTEIGWMCWPVHLVTSSCLRTSLTTRCSMGALSLSSCRTAPWPTAYRTAPWPTACRTAPGPTAYRTSPSPTAYRTSPSPTAYRTSPWHRTAGQRPDPGQQDIALTQDSRTPPWPTAYRTSPWPRTAGQRHDTGPAVLAERVAADRHLCGQCRSHSPGHGAGVFCGQCRSHSPGHGAGVFCGQRRSHSPGHGAGVFCGQCRSHSPGHGAGVFCGQCRSHSPGHGAGVFCGQSEATPHHELPDRDPSHTKPPYITSYLTVLLHTQSHPKRSATRPWSLTHKLSHPTPWATRSCSLTH